MPDIRVRGVSEDIVHLLKGQAKRNGQTLQSVLMEVLTEAALRPRRQLIAELMAHQEQMREACGVLPDSTLHIREERDRWG